MEMGHRVDPHMGPRDREGRGQGHGTQTQDVVWILGHRAGDSLTYGIGDTLHVCGHRERPECGADGGAGVAGKEAATASAGTGAAGRQHSSKNGKGEPGLGRAELWPIWRAKGCPGP